MAHRRRLMVMAATALAITALAVPAMTTSAADTGTFAFTGSGGLNGSSTLDRVAAEGQLIPQGTGSAAVVFSCQAAVVEDASATGVGCVLRDSATHTPVAGTCCRFLPGLSSNQEFEATGLTLQSYEICVTGYFLPVFDPSTTSVEFSSVCQVPTL